nr:immunoglobulin heavy chain junction region [Macaca mulatta]
CARRGSIVVPFTAMGTVYFDYW